MRPIRPLFRNNGRLGTPQCHGTFQEWIGDPSRGKGKPPLDVNRDPSTVPGIIARTRERKEFTCGEAETLRVFLIETIREKTYREWLASSGLGHFFHEDDWNDQDNHRKFALYVLACFVDFFRQGQIDWRTPNTCEMQLVAKLLNIFADPKDADQQRKLLRGLFVLEENLKGIAVETSTILSLPYHLDSSSSCFFVLLGAYPIFGQATEPEALRAPWQDFFLDKGVMP